MKIADFWFARRCQNSSERRVLSDTFCGSVTYEAPEVLKGLPYNPTMSDIWWSGCILFIMLMATCLFMPPTENRRSWNRPQDEYTSVCDH
jgi:serine kinase